MNKLILNLKKQTAKSKLLKKLYYIIRDNLELFFRMRNSLYPPKHLENVGTKYDFISVGNEFIEYFLNLLGLKQNSILLDCGCGCGRISIPLTKYLTEGSYYGFDIVKDSIIFCQRNITKKFPNFHFHHFDIKNTFYNPNGKYLSKDFQFPYKFQFDFIISTSLFTHLFRNSVKNYLTQITKCLKNNGKTLSTFFLVNDESLKFLQEKKAHYPFKYNKSMDCWIWNNYLGFAYNENEITELYEKNNLKIEKIYYGNWIMRENSLSFQDIIISTKKCN